jgi:hypothetical protein
VTLFSIIILTSCILYLEQKDPQQYSINQISNVTLHTPVQVKGRIHPLYETSQFSVVEIYNKTHSEKKILATLQSNTSQLKNTSQYIINGVVRVYEGEKQIEIYSIQSEK